jgi:hypothetical protein
MIKRTGHCNAKQAVLLVVLLAILLHGCGGGTQSGGLAVCTQDTFTPNYVPDIELLLRWSSFPVRVYFEKDENYAPEYQQIAEEGFKQWVGASGEVIQYRILSTPERVHITVKFDPTTRNGFTSYRYYTHNHALTEATITIGIKDNQQVDIQSVAAHEFGHAIGIGGHSTHLEDMMYPTFTTGVPLGVTVSDLNTVKTAYCPLFPKPDITGRGQGSISETTIRCGNDR